MSAPPEGRPFRVAVIGGSRASEADLALAHELGARLGEAGAVVICGGIGGVMEAAARGARESDGLTVGILPGPEAGAANAWITLPLATGMGEARNALVVRAAEAVVAVGGAWGTLSEIALAVQMGRPVATLGAPPAGGLGLPALEGAEEAAAWALERAREARARGVRGPP